MSAGVLTQPEDPALMAKHAPVYVKLRPWVRQVLINRHIPFRELDDICTMLFLRAARPNESVQIDRVGFKQWALMRLLDVGRDMLRSRGCNYRTGRWYVQRDADFSLLAPEAGEPLAGTVTQRKALAHEPDLGLAYDVHEALETLMPSLRCIGRLYFLEGYSCPEIGPMISRPVSSVYGLVHDVREMLRDKLKAYAAAS